MAFFSLTGFAASNVDLSTATVVITLAESSPVYNNAVQAPTITKVVVNGVEYTSEWTQFFTPKYYKQNSAENWIAQNANQIQDAGVYGVTIVANGATDAEREITYTAGAESPLANKATYTIQKKDLNVTLANGTKQYGGTDPTKLDITPTNLPTGWTTPEFSWTGPLPIEGAHANVSAEGYSYNFPLNTLEGQTFISAVNYNVFITNQPKLIVTKKSLTLDYKGTAAQPVKVYGNATLNDAFIAASKVVDNYTLHEGSTLEGGDALATVLAGITAAGKVTTEFNYAGDPAKESATVDPTGAALAGAATHTLTILIDENVAANYKFTVNPVGLTIKQATLSAAADAPFTFAKAESGAFTYNADNQNLTKTVTYTANSEQLLADGADPAVTAQVAVTYKVKALGTTTDATTDAANTKAAGIYEAYIAPASATGNFYTEGYAPIRLSAFDFTINKKALYVYVTEDPITEVYKGSAYTLPTSTAITFQGLETADATALATPISKVVAKVAVTTGGVTTLETTVTRAGTYTIKPDVTVDDAADLHVNYAVQAYETTYTVSPLAITIDPNDMNNIAYSSDIAGSYPATAGGAGNVTVAKVNETDPGITNDDQTKVLSAYNVVVADQTYAAGGTYTGAITLAKKTLDPENADDAIIISMLKNFTITEGTGDITIGNGSYSLVVKDKIKTYGDALAWTEFDDYLTPGLTGDTKPSVVKFILVNTADATDIYSQNDDATKLPKNAGTYTIKVDVENSNLEIANYTAPTEAAGTLVAGTLTINPLAITITPKAVTLNAGATTSTLNKYGSVNYSVPLKGTDKIGYTLAFNTAVVTVSGAEDPAVMSPASATPYENGVVAKALTAEELAAGTYANANYDITWGTGDLTIGAAAALVLDPTDTQLDLKIGDAADESASAEATKFDISFDNKTMQIGEWYAMVLPFDVDPLKMVSAFNRYVIFNELNKAGTTDQNFKFTLTLNTIPAGTPFLIKFAPKTGDAADAVVNWKTDFNSGAYGTVTIKKGVNDVETDYVVLTGTYTAKDLKGLKDGDGEKVWWLADKTYTNGAGWKKPKTNMHTAAPMEAYLTAEGKAWTTYSPTITVEDFDGMTTAIKSLSVDKINDLKTDGLYNLQGVKVQGAVKKGIYIQNGKKILVK